MPVVPADLTRIAYFSMEVGLVPEMPTYSGGLGVLAGDTLRAAAVLGVPMVGVTLLHRKGYFRQQLDASGNQSEGAEEWKPEDFLELLDPRVTVFIEGQQVLIRAWRFLIHGVSGHIVPVVFLDTSLDSNDSWARTFTDCLYGGDQRYRLCQETVLGIGGVGMLRALGFANVMTFHMNEGHSALLALGLLAEERREGTGPPITGMVRESVRHRCVFTTHTPVPAGHDQFPIDLARRVIGDEMTNALADAGCCLDDTLNMTYLALSLSHYVNGVAMRHREVSQSMFPNYPINSITNGVHATTWTSVPFQQVYDRHIPEWRRDNLYLRYAISIPVGEIQQAHAEAKHALLADVEQRTGTRLDATMFTLGFARRATPYKRADLLFSNLDRLRHVAREAGPIQIIYAGKAHPRDGDGKAMIRRIFEAATSLKDTIRVVYLPDYDMAQARLLCSGVDIWLNTPLKPREASGTSGMKAALNGVPSFSILDGWWVEGHLEGLTGWSIGDDATTPDNQTQEMDALYGKLEYAILPLFYRRPSDYATVMRSSIALNGSFFNAQRMVGQYLQDAYVVSPTG